MARIEYFCAGCNNRLVTRDSGTVGTICAGCTEALELAGYKAPLQVWDARSGNWTLSPETDRFLRERREGLQVRE